MAELRFVRQPDGADALGDVVLAALADPTWVSLRAAIAYVKVSGVQHLSGPLQAFVTRAPGDCKLVVGVDQQGSSIEAVEELFLILDAAGGELWILRNPAGSPSPTFHPKLWYFTDPARSQALVVAGSGNLTEGGLFGNYEATTVAKVDPADAGDAQAMADIDAMFADWTDPTKPHLVRADVASLQSLHDSGELPSEDTIRRATRIARSASARLAAGATKKATSGLFKGSPVKKAPAPAKRAVLPARPVKRKAPLVAAAPPPVAPVPAPGPTAVGAPVFVPIHRVLRMTVRPQQKTEIYLTKGVLDQDPAFFGAPFTGLTTPKVAANSPQPQPDPLPTVSLTVYGPGGAVVATEPVHALKMWTYTNGPSANDDFRITLPSQMLQHVPNDTILVMERDPATPGLDYALSFFPPGHPDYAAHLARCTEAIRNSPRRYGWE